MRARDILNPPAHLTVGEYDYEINTDFSVWIEIEGLLSAKCENQYETIARVLSLAYKRLPESPTDALNALLQFYSGGGTSNNPPDASDGREKTRVYDLDRDFEYIWAAFLSEFGIDLTSVSLHWWRFKALLGCLGESCKFSRIVAYRSIDLSSVTDKEMRRFYERMKKEYRLSGESSRAAQEAETARALGEVISL